MVLSMSNLNKNVKKNKHNTGKSNIASITIYCEPDFKAYVKQVSKQTGTNSMGGYLRQLFVSKHGLPGKE